jgi:hypothetical protein
MAGTLIFDFFKASEKDKAITAAKRYFQRAGAPVATVDVDQKVTKVHGVSTRLVHFGFADNQKVSFGVTETGDIYQVKLNDKVLPLRAQDDQAGAIAEIVAAMAKGRAKFQAALARVKVDLPQTIRTAAPNVEKDLKQKIALLDESISEARQTLADLRAISE